MYNYFFQQTYVFSFDGKTVTRHMLRTNSHGVIEKEDYRKDETLPDKFLPIGDIKLIYEDWSNYIVHVGSSKFTRQFIL